MIDRYPPYIVAKAVRLGLLRQEPCARCGNTKVHAHHEDYSKLLDVIWLCPSCHKLRHEELKREGNSPVSDYYVRAHANRVPLSLPRDLVVEIDSYWHHRRLRTRNEAIRELLAYALDAKLAKPAKEQRR